MNKPHFQIAVAGSGFAGPIMAMIAQRLGFATVLIERGRHPRFAIGESSTPLANLLLEEIAEAYDLPFLRPLCKWGTWQKQLPQLACGLKRGFTFYQHELGQRFTTDANHRQQFLVGASPNEAVADTHWYRADFDHYLVAQAQNLGVTYWDETELHGASEASAGMRLTGTRYEEPVEVVADFVIDATGPRGFLHRALGLTERPFPSFPLTQGLFSHFRDVGPLPDSFSIAGQTTPYPPEQAAVHHIFSDGWVWVLKFNNGITSAGVAATDAAANEMEFRTGEPAWRRLLERLPSLGEIFGSADAVLPFAHSPRLAFQSARVTGSSWALLPSAVGFVDPLLSTGFALTLLGITRMAGLLRSRRRGADLRRSLGDYAALTTLELATAARLVGSLYATMDRFDLFRELSLLYFAAVSFSETVRRLGKPQLAQGFLLCRHPGFAGQFRELCETVKDIRSADGIKEFGERVRNTIEPFDLAGLADPSRQHWYPAAAADLLRNGRKAGATEVEMLAMLQRCGLGAG